MSVVQVNTYFWHPLGLRQFPALTVQPWLSRNILVHKSELLSLILLLDLGALKITTQYYSAARSGVRVIMGIYCSNSYFTVFAMQCHVARFSVPFAHPIFPLPFLCSVQEHKQPLFLILWSTVVGLGKSQLLHSDRTQGFVKKKKKRR